MSRIIPSDEMAEMVRSLITAVSSSMGTEITTPVIYPDGGCVTVVVAPETEGYLVHDAGLGVIYFARDGISLTRDLIGRLSAVAKRYDCQFEGGRMVRRCDPTNVPTSVMLVANASRTIGDMSVEARRQSESHFRYVVTERVRELVGLRLRENETFKGKSGASYRVTNTILDEAGQEPVAFLLPLPSRGSVSPQFRELYDLRAAFPSVVRGSVYDEESDFRPEEDRWILSEVAEVIGFRAIGEALPILLAPKSANTLLH